MSTPLLISLAASLNSLNKLDMGTASVTGLPAPPKYYDSVLYRWSDKDLNPRDQLWKLNSYDVPICGNRSFSCMIASREVLLCLF